MAYRELQMLGHWATDELKDLVYGGGFARGGGGGSYGGQRVIHGERAIISICCDDVPAMLW